MAYQSVWYFTDVPSDIVKIIEKDLEKNFDHEMEESCLIGGATDKKKRNSENAWVPSHHWLGGFLWHYIERANRENFLYDLRCIDGESMQYTRYSAGQFYGWHNDAGFSQFYKPVSDGRSEKGLGEDFIQEKCELIRKLSFVLQLSEYDEYEGGNLQLLDESGNPYFAPRKRGTIILFDSRTQHRVLPVKSGIRKSIVGWTIGPRWK